MSEDDLRQPLDLGPEFYVVSPGSRQLPVIHYAEGCGSLARSDTSQWPRLARDEVERLRALEVAEARRFHFCLNCVAGDSHPLMTGTT